MCSVEQTRGAAVTHDSADWDDMVQQIVQCTAVQTPMNSGQYLSPAA